jgi:Rad3-related DNA helicase
MAGDDLDNRMVHIETLTTEKVLPTLGRLEEKMDTALMKLENTVTREEAFKLQLALEQKADKAEVNKLKETLIRWSGAIGVLVFILSVFGRQIVEALTK